MKRVLIEDEKQRCPAFVDRVGDTLWVHYLGQTFSISLNELKSRRARVEIYDTPDIFAPMPGKITQVLCKKNDHVKGGQVLIVMEAMKMEYNLKASKEGAIETVEVKISDQVQVGQMLVKVRIKT